MSTTANALMGMPMGIIAAAYFALRHPAVGGHCVHQVAHRREHAGDPGHGPGNHQAQCNLVVDAEHELSQAGVDGHVGAIHQNGMGRPVVEVVHRTRVLSVRPKRAWGEYRCGARLVQAYRDGRLSP